MLSRSVGSVTASLPTDQHSFFGESFASGFYWGSDDSISSMICGASGSVVGLNR
ncbi:MAG: hypothetical protein JWM49_1594 [Microbacteriaceae bacterium]|nr:hypothetical protein [Microbacteriaceae bacterium]